MKANLLSMIRKFMKEKKNVYDFTSDVVKGKM